MDPNESLSPSFQELMIKSLNSINEAIRGHDENFRVLNTKIENLSTPSRSEDAFTPIREMTRGESLFNVTENFGKSDSPRSEDPPPKLPSNLRASNASFPVSS